mgnify:CR=1 FL=1
MGKESRPPQATTGSESQVRTRDFHVGKRVRVPATTPFSCVFGLLPDKRRRTRRSRDTEPGPLPGPYPIPAGPFTDSAGLPTKFGRT